MSVVSELGHEGFIRLWRRDEFLHPVDLDLPVLERLRQALQHLGLMGEQPLVLEHRGMRLGALVVKVRKRVVSVLGRLLGYSQVHEACPELPWRRGEHLAPPDVPYAFEEEWRWWRDDCRPARFLPWGHAPCCALARSRVIVGSRIWRDDRRRPVVLPLSSLKDALHVLKKAWCALELAIVFPNRRHWRNAWSQAVLPPWGHDNAPCHALRAHERDGLR